MFRMVNEFGLLRQGTTSSMLCYRGMQHNLIAIVAGKVADGEQENQQNAGFTGDTAHDVRDYGKRPCALVSSAIAEKRALSPLAK